jgi:hypothetical protein
MLQLVLISVTLAVSDFSSIEVYTYAGVHGFIISYM